MARTIYNEPYVAAPLTHEIAETGNTITATSRLLFAGQVHTVRVTGSTPGYLPAEDSVEHFFKEHHWGFNKDRSGRTIRYRVDHPLWLVYPVQSFELHFDWGMVYGPEWQFLAGKRPYSVVFAEGSAIKVFPKGVLVA
jgi:hypothetical protein